MKTKMVAILLASLVCTSVMAAEAVLRIGRTESSTLADLKKNGVTENDLLEGKSNNFCFSGDQKKAAALVKAALNIASGDYSVTSLSVDSASSQDAIIVKATFFGEDGGHSKKLKISRCE